MDVGSDRIGSNVIRNVLLVIVQIMLSQMGRKIDQVTYFTGRGIRTYWDDRCKILNYGLKSLLIVGRTQIFDSPIMILIPALRQQWRSRAVASIITHSICCGYVDGKVLW